MIVSVKEVKDYTESDELKKRKDSNIEADILLAEAKIKSIFRHNDKSLTEVLKDKKEVPVEIKQAIIMYAEFYGKRALTAAFKGLQSESYDDYSYQIADIDSVIKEPIIQPLIEEFLQKEKPRTQVDFKMRLL